MQPLSIKKVTFKSGNLKKYLVVNEDLPPEPKNELEMEKNPPVIKPKVIN